MTSWIEPHNIVPGIYDISNEEYHNGPGISRTGLMTFKRSPKHYWFKYICKNRDDEEDTKAKFFGRALHTYILEPHIFESTYLVVNKVDGRTKEGKAYNESVSVQAAYENKIMLARDMFDDIKFMADSINKDELATQLISGAQYEKTIYWIDPDTGILCKARPDIWHKAIGLVGDLKTSKDANPRDYSYDVFNYGYHVQAAMIREGLLHTKNPVPDEFIEIVIEKDAPYVSVPYRLSDRAIDKGLEYFKTTLQDFKRSLDANYWPGYTFQEIDLPAYAYKEQS